MTQTQSLPPPCPACHPPPARVAGGYRGYFRASRRHPWQQLVAGARDYDAAMARLLRLVPHGAPLGELYCGTDAPSH